MINVTKAYLPPFEKYTGYLKKIWDSAWLTNNGPLVQELEERLKLYLGVRHCFFCNNGTIALQVAIKSLELSGDIITTPFSYVATPNAIEWENNKAVFSDVNEWDFNINPFLIENLITENTSAIMPVHVYGNPADVEAIGEIAQDHRLKVIYDAAHAFGAKLHNQSLLSFGDISTCSLHSTKLFHSCEGGLIITNNDELADRIYLMRQFGHKYDDYYFVGINAKNSELHAAMGLCILDDIDEIMMARKRVFEVYDSLLDFEILKKPVPLANSYPNYSYYPVLFPAEMILLFAIDELAKVGIKPRRYFYPSLNTLSFFKSNHCPVSESISSRILALPLYPGLQEDIISVISEIVNRSVRRFRHPESK